MKKARKVVSVISALLMLALLATACGTSGGPAASVSPSAEPSAAPSVAPSVAPSAAPSAAAPSSAGAEDKAGYLTDKFDHFSRDPFKIAYICNNISWVWNAAISETLDTLGKVLNYDYVVFSANGDADAYINQITTLADQGVQGFICGVDDALAPRVYEVCTELKVPFIAESTAFNQSGKNIWLSVVQDQYNNGAACVQWLVDNYKNYWKDPIDTSKLGLIVLDYSVVLGIHDREPGAKDTFLKAFPEAAGNYIQGDLVSLGTTGFSMQGGNDLTSSILSAHPEIEKWFIVGLVDDWAQGAARAAETLGKTEDVLISSVQADAFINEMKTGNTDSCYVSACAVSSTEFAVNLALGVVTLLEGRATAQTLWPEYQVDGFAQMKVLGTMITKDIYQEFIDTHTVDAYVAAAKQA